jgi:hypothetical protein
VRANRDLDLTRSRFIGAVTHIRDGLRLCRDRVIDVQAKAPRLLEGTPHEVINLTEVPESDLDYYAYELGRLRHVAIAVLPIFGEPQELVAAVATFDAAIPHLKAIRDPLTHRNDTDELDDVSWLGALVRLRMDGSVEYLIDARYQQHDEAEALAAALLDYLRVGLRSS